MSFLKTAMILFIFGSAISSCEVKKYLKVTGGSKSDGILVMKYEYGAFEDPVVQWDHAKRKAIKRCKQWGYSDAEFFESGTQECIYYNSDGNCTGWRVTYKCQCTY